MADTEETKNSTTEQLKEDVKKNGAKENEPESKQETNGTQERNGDTTEETQDCDQSSLEKDIIRQIEYYFGDINLPRDKFLQEQIKLDDGWVPLEVLLKFHRLSKLSTDIAVIADAVKNSTAGLVEVSEDGTKIRRNPQTPAPEMTEERRKEIMTRTLYVKGFPKAANLDTCINYFKDYPVENVHQRKYLVRSTHTFHFKGSVFATFRTKEAAQKFFDTPGHKYEDTELIVKWQDDYNKSKREEYQSLKEKKTAEKAKKEQEKEKEGPTLPLGAVLHFTVSGAELTREHIKEAIAEKDGEVVFINFNKGDKEGYVRLQKEGGAQALLDQLTDSKMSVQGAELTLRALAGDEETDFLKDTSRQIMERRRNQNKKAARGRGGRFGGGNRKRKQGPSSDAPANKVAATE